MSVGQTILEESRERAILRQAHEELLDPIDHTVQLVEILCQNTVILAQPFAAADLNIIRNFAHKSKEWVEIFLAISTIQDKGSVGKLNGYQRGFLQNIIGYNDLLLKDTDRLGLGQIAPELQRLERLGKDSLKKVEEIAEYLERPTTTGITPLPLPSFAIAAMSAAFAAGVLYAGQLSLIIAPAFLTVSFSLVGLADLMVRRSLRHDSGAKEGK